MATWIIEELKTVERGSLEHGTQPVREWRQVPYWGTHPSRLAAMRRVLEEYEPDLKGTPDSHIRRHWRQFSRWQGMRTSSL